MQNIMLFIISLFLLTKLTAQNKDVIQVSDLTKIKQVGNVTLTKDGSVAAFTVSSIEPDGESKLDYKPVSQVYIVNTGAGSIIKQLTFSKEGSSQPSWSADGRRLAFVRVVDSKPQVFILPMDGGEAIQITHYKYGASNPKWSPDGKQILFSSSPSLIEILKDSLLNPTHSIPTWSLERPGFEKNEYLKASSAKPNPDGSIEEIRAYLDKDELDKKAKVITRLNFQDETGVSTDINFNSYFLIDAKEGSQPTPVLKGFYRYTSADFTPDGNSLIVSGFVDSIQNPNRASTESQILISDLNGNLRPLLTREKVAFTNPVISLSGKWMAFQSSKTETVNIPRLFIMPFKGTVKDTFSIPFDRSIGTLLWSTDEKYIYFTAQSNGGAPLYRANITTKKVEQLSDYNSGLLSGDIAGNKVVFTKTEVADPSELYIADGTLKNARQVSSFNDWVKNKKLSMPEKKTFTNNKGMTIEYWVMKPTNYVAGKKFPLLLEIHGGPSAMWGPGEQSMWHEFQYFCGKGYGVVYCNPRGSGGYNEEFLRANVNDWGNGPTSDVLTALDKTVAEGWADTSKLVVTGGSYAGYLVAYIIGHDKRFKAACSQRGVYDLATFFGEGNAWRLVPNYFGGYPWEPQVQQVLQRESPISYVQNITTPYIIFHGENDRRTGFVQSEMLYRSLKVLGRPVEYVRHPGGTHELTRSGDPRQRIDQMLRTYEFFDRWLSKK